jgi:signal transduction histidine kinase
MLEDDGYTVEEVEDGIATLAMFETLRPDLILLDALMPKKDGFEVCTALQKMPGGDRTPVLMITGLDDEESVDRAFEVGAVDYVTKPVQWPVLRQRVRRLIRTRQLEKLRDDLMQMIVHDMKSPIATIRGYAELVLSDEPEDPFVADSLTRIFHSSNSLLNMTMMILDIGRLEEGKMTLEPVKRKVRGALDEVASGFEWMASNYQVKLEIGECSEELSFTLDWSLMLRVLSNLTSNAIKHSPSDAVVTLSAVSTDGADGALRISVTDQGEGISDQDQKRIFEKFTQATGRKRGSRTDTGLGLTFCKLATEAHGGRIELKSAVGAGSTFTLVFPRPLSPDPPLVLEAAQTQR